MKSHLAKQIRFLRFVIAISVIVMPILAVFFKGEIGTLCGVCPIGLLQIAVTSGTVTPLLIYSIIGAVVLAAMSGKAFCAWVCPTLIIPVKRTRNKWRGVVATGFQHSGQSSSKIAHQKGEARSSSEKIAFGKKKASIHFVTLLAAVLLVSILFGFPVFCLVCPIGLVFAFALSVLKVFTTYQATWDLVIIPLILLLEFTVSRSWCRLFCPIGAMLGLVSRISPFTLSKRKCREKYSHNHHCDSCALCCRDSEGGKNPDAPEETVVDLGQKSSEDTIVCKKHNA